MLCGALGFSGESCRPKREKGPHNPNPTQGSSGSACLRIGVPHTTTLQIKFPVKSLRTELMPNFRDGEMEASQRGKLTGPRPHSKPIAELLRG